MPEFKEGLEGVVATKTELSSIDGKKGNLTFRGYDIKDLADNSNFEEVAYLLWHGKLPTKKELSSFSKKIRNERKLDEEIIDLLKSHPDHIEGMDALRTVTSFLAHTDEDLNDNSRGANIRKSIRLAAKFPTIVASFNRIKNGKDQINPDPELAHGENFLYMLRGEKPNETEAKAMEKDFLMIADHGLNASTFSARVTTSTLSDYHSAICSAIGTLKGPLHGGARAKTYEMLENVKDPDNSYKFVKDKIKNHEVIMGFGHRVYKTTDPRAKILKVVSKRLAEENDNTKWHDISAELEKAVLKEIVEKKGKPIYPNVDFWTGSVYHYLNIPKNLTNALFAIGRIIGWSAHVMEQYENNRLIRPRAEYIGDKNKKYIPIEER